MAKTDPAEFEKVIKGDERAFMRIFDALYPSMVQRAVFFVGSQTAAEDIVQEAFIRIWNNHRKLGGVRNIELYLSAGIRNHCLNYLEHLEVEEKYRRNYKHQVLDPQDADPEPYIAAIALLIARMPDKRRQAFEMSVFENTGYVHIAEQMGISVNTVKDHIKKAYEFLRNNSEYIPYP